MQPSSIKGLVAGIQFHLRCLDPSTISLLRNPSVRLLLNGLKKEKPQGNDSSSLHSYTLEKTNHILKGGCFGQYTDLLLETVFLTAFYGFLRGGEFTTRTGSFDPSHNLTIADVSINPHHFSYYSSIQRLMGIGKDPQS